MRSERESDRAARGGRPAEPDGSKGIAPCRAPRRLTTIVQEAPIVSVLLPVRDAGVHLDQALASMAAQTFGAYELIAVDDGSTDGSAERLERWAERDPRIRVLRRAAEGIEAALEHARGEARGRYIARMDADDVSAPTRLESQLAMMERHPDWAGCGCLVRYFPDEAVQDGARRYETWINTLVTPSQIERGIFVECPLAHPTFFMRADSVASAGGYRATGGPEDYDLLLRMWAEGHRFGKVPEVLHRWRERDDRLSRTDPRYAPEAFMKTKVRYLVATLLRQGRRVVIWGAGPVGKSMSRALRDVGVDVDRFVELDPRKIGQVIHGAGVVDTDAGVSIRGPLHVAAVGQEGARERISGLLEAAGMMPMEDFVAVA